MGAVVFPDGRRLYVSTGRGGTVVSIDTKTHQPVGSVAVGPRPWGLALSPDGTRLYTANRPSNDVSVVDTSTLGVVTKVAVGQSPWGWSRSPFANDGCDVVSAALPSQKSSYVHLTFICPALPCGLGGVRQCVNGWLMGEASDASS